MCSFKCAPRAIVQSLLTLKLWLLHVVRCSRMHILTYSVRATSCFTPFPPAQHSKRFCKTAGAHSLSLVREEQLLSLQGLPVRHQGSRRRLYKPSVPLSQHCLAFVARSHDDSGASPDASMQPPLMNDTPRPEEGLPRRSWPREAQHGLWEALAAESLPDKVRLTGGAAELGNGGEAARELGTVGGNKHGLEHVGR